MSLEGFAELDRKLRALGPAVGGKILRQAVRQAVKPALSRAKETVPVGTVAHKTYKGRLVSPGFALRSLRIITTKLIGGAAALLGVRREAYYALQFIELGTAKYPRHPWLGPAFQATQQQQIEALAKALKERIEKAARS
jgi:phage protein, HK97 gp10 family